MMNSQSLLGQAVVLEPARNADNVLQPLVDATTPLIIRGHSSTQTGALLRFEDSLGNLLSSVSASGALTGAGIGGAVTLTPSTVNRNFIQPTVDTVSPLSLSGHSATQSVPLFDVIDDGVGSVFQVASAGQGVGWGVVISAASVGQTALQVYPFNANPAGSSFQALSGSSGLPLFTVGAVGVSFFNATPVVRQTNGTAADLAAIADPPTKAFLTALSTGLVNLGLFAAPA